LSAGLPEDWIQSLVAALLRPDVERILLFGSRARGEDDSSSDVDLIIIRDTSASFLQRLAESYQQLADAALRLGVDVDLLVYTPEEYRRLLEDENPLITTAHREGKVLYERPPSGSGTVV
jgi:predicted nucleotidyltransferase